MKGDALTQSFEMGLASAVDGPNTINCDFWLFATPEQTKAWEQGREAGQLELKARAAGRKEETSQYLRP